jgi:dsRNA-specific ribonuclease
MVFLDVLFHITQMCSTRFHLNKNERDNKSLTFLGSVVVNMNILLPK